MPAPAEVSQNAESGSRARSSWTTKLSVGASSRATPVRCFEASASVEFLARSRIMHDDPFSGDRLEHHEVAHVPVQDRREP